MCRTLRARYVCLEETKFINECIIDDASKNNKKISLFHAHFFVPCLIFCACLLPVSFSFYIILAVLMRTCWGQHSCMSSHSYSHTECYLLLSRNEMVLAYRQKIRLSKTNYNNNYKYLPLRYIFFTWHPIITRPPYNQYLNYICMVLVRWFNSVSEVKKLWWKVGQSYS